VIDVRPMRWPDIERVHRIELECFPDTAWSKEAFWAELARSPHTRAYWVAEHGDELVGYVGLMAVPPDADIQTLAVDGSHRRRGVGSRLLAAAVAEAEHRGCGSLMLEVAASNTAAQRLYERRGFEPLARRSSYYGPGRDALVMRMALRAAAGEGAR
jgi:ribosomal-protein-alanine N-acetyltransferase